MHLLLENGHFLSDNANEGQDGDEELSIQKTYKSVSKAVRVFHHVYQICVVSQPLHAIKLKHKKRLKFFICKHSFVYIRRLVVVTHKTSV